MHRGVAPTSPRGFTLIEVLVVIVVIGILAAVAVPQISVLREDARDQAGRNTLHGVRTAIASFRGRAVIESNDPYPTLAELTTVGSVLDIEIGENPWTGVSGVRSASAFEGVMRSVVSPESFGWAYYVDNTASAPVAIFFANSTTQTRIENPSSGSDFTANNL